MTIYTYISKSFQSAGGHPKVASILDAYSLRPIPFFYTQPSLPKVYPYNFPKASVVS